MSSSSPPPTPGNILRRFRARIAVTFSLLTLENIALVITPWLVGIAIDDLLVGDSAGLWWLAGLLSVGAVIGTSRRLFDTRTYTRIQATLASETVERGWRCGTPVSTLAARVDLLREMVGFLESELVTSYNALIKVLGALAMLWFFSPWLLLAALLAGLAVMLVYALSARRIYRLNRGLNDRLELQVKALESGCDRGVWRHFNAVARWRVRLSDLEASNFCVIDLVLIALVLGALGISVSLGIHTPGQLFAVLSYVLELSEGAWLLPLVFQQWVRVREIAQRFRIGEAEAINETNMS